MQLKSASEISAMAGVAKEIMKDVYVQLAMMFGQDNKEAKQAIAIARHIQMLKDQIFERSEWIVKKANSVSTEIRNQNAFEKGKGFQPKKSGGKGPHRGKLA